jgi:hypothetical protein
MPTGGTFPSTIVALMQNRIMMQNCITARVSSRKGLLSGGTAPSIDSRSPRDLADHEP